MKTISTFMILECSDKTEGRGPMIETNIAFEVKVDAIEFVNSQHYKRFAVMGVVPTSYPETYIREKIINVFTDVQDYEDNSKFVNDERIKKSALNKLTNQEKQILGL